jgi:hypothetical protein
MAKPEFEKLYGQAVGEDEWEMTEAFYKITKHPNNKAFVDFYKTFSRKAIDILLRYVAYDSESGEIIF